MNKKYHKIIFRADDETQIAFQELKDKYCVNISAFLRKCLVAKHQQMKFQDQDKVIDEIVNEDH